MSLESRVPRMRIAMLALVLLAACSKKEDAPAATGAPRSKEERANGALALASADSELAANAKAALVVQQCSIACGAKPGIDTSACTSVCAERCKAETEIARVDACASKVASESPPL